MAASKKGMKILLVEPFAHRGGHHSAYPNYLTHALANAGADVTLVTFKEVLSDGTGKDTRIKHISVLSEAGIFAPLLRFLRGFLYLVIPLRPFITLFETFFTFLLASWQNRRQRHDVIHIIDTSMPTFLPLAFAFIAKCNLVCNLNNPSELSTLNRARFAAPLQKFLYQRAIKSNHIAFLCHSKQVQDSYADSVFRDTLGCIPWGIEKPEKQTLTQHEARQFLSLPQGEKLLLSFGINHPRKNFEVIFQALQDLTRDFKLLFAGKILLEDAKQNDPRRFAQEYGWSDDTIIVDKHIPEEEMPYYFCAADAIILSYRKEFIGASGILSHAAGFNLPVIASDIGQLGEFVKDYGLGLLFTPDDSHSLREAILSFLNLGEEEKEEMRRNLQKFASIHSWEEVAKEHFELYQSLSRKAK